MAISEGYRAALNPSKVSNELMSVWQSGLNTRNILMAMKYYNASRIRNAESNYCRK